MFETKYFFHGGVRRIAGVIYSCHDAAKQKSISDVVTKYCSSSSLKNRDDKSIRLLQKIKKEYDVDATDIVHLHCKPGGSGKFVLHGFILRNVFEIVIIDPNHEILKSK